MGEATTQDELLALIRNCGNPRSWHIVAKDRRGYVTRLVLSPMMAVTQPQTSSLGLPITITLTNTDHPFLTMLVDYGECAFVMIPGLRVSAVPYEPVLSPKAWEALQAAATNDNVMPDVDSVVRKEFERESLVEDGKLTARACYLIRARATALAQYADLLGSEAGAPPVPPPASTVESNTTVEKKLRIPAPLVQFIEHQAERRGNDFTAMSREILYQWAKANGHDPDRSAAVAAVRQPWAPPRTISETTAASLAGVTDAAGRPLV